MTPESESRPKEKEEDKKKGAAPVPASGGGAGSSFSLEQLESLQNTLMQAGVSAAPAEVSLAAALASKIGVVMIVAMMSAGAMNLARKPNNLPAFGKVRAKAEKPKYEGDLSKLPKSPDQQDAIQGVVLGDLSGKTDEQKAADQAAADAAAKAEADAAAKAQAEKDEAGKAAAAQASATPAMAAGDLTAKAAKMPGGKAGSLDHKFGNLSSSLPGGGGGGGTAAPSGPAFTAAPTLAGKSQGMGANAAAKTAGATKGLGAGLRGSAARQLTNANSVSRMGAGSGTGEGAAQGASGAFDNNRGGGSAISGGGAGITGAGATMGATDTKPNAGGNPISDGVGRSDGTSAPPDAGHSNATPWQTFVDIATWAMLIAGVMLVLSYILAQAAKKTTPIGSTLMSLAMACAGIATACAAIATLCGIAVLAMGQTMQGLMFTVGGAVTTYLAYKQLTNEMDESAKAHQTLISGPDTPANSAMQSQMGGSHYNLGDYASQLRIASLA